MKAAEMFTAAKLKGSIANAGAFTILAFCAVWMGGQSVADELIYRNDFSTRESARPIPAYNIVREAQPYATEQIEKLCFIPEFSTGYQTANAADLAKRESYYAKAVGTGNDRPGYDGWYSPYFQTTSPTQYKLFPTILNVDADPCFTFYTDLANASLLGTLIHPFHNRFTNGQIRVQVDMRPPETWIDKNKTLYFRVFPVYEKYMDPIAWDGNQQLESLPGRAGFTGPNSSSSSYTPSHTFCRIFGSSRAQLGYSFDASAIRDWYRFITIYDLDAGIVTGKVYRLSNVGHPTLETDEAEVGFEHSKSRPGEALSLPALTDETGGVAGIAINAYGYFHTTATTTNKVLLDNIRLSWKPTGSSDFDVFYENDFSNRWYKTVCANRRGTQARGTTPQTTYTNLNSTITQKALPNPSGNSYSTNGLVPAISASPSAAQPVGFDGWRRLPYMDENVAYCCNTTSGGNSLDSGFATNYLAFGHSESFHTPACALIANRIGDTYTSGKVHLSVDARLPTAETIKFTADRLRMAVGLGSAGLYTASRAALAGNLVAGVGYRRTLGEGATNHVPYVLAPAMGADVTCAYETAYTEPTTPYIYRLEIVADLDARTYGVTVTPLSALGVDSSFMPTEAPIYSKTGLPFASSVTDIGTFYLYGFGSFHSGNIEQNVKWRVTFDNIRIWHQAAGAAAETLVYFNDFKRRTYASESATVARATGYIADLYDNDDGVDHWLRRDWAGEEGYWASATVREDAGNRFLALGRELEQGCRVQVSHTFGTYLRRGFRFSFDIRPPAAWRVGAGGFATVSFGDAQMEQTQVAESIFNAHRQIAFGLRDSTDGLATFCQWYRVGMEPVAYTAAGGVMTAVPLASASAISNDHWYRFAGQVDMADGTYSVKLLDMGAAHPVESSVPVATVGAAEGLSFLNDLAVDEGIGAFNIEAYGMGGVIGNAGMDEDNVLIDNIQVQRITFGTTVIFR